MAHASPFLATLLLGTLAVSAARAQDPDEAELADTQLPEAEPGDPALRAARLVPLAGTTHVGPTDGELTPGVRNLPIVAGHRVQVAPEGRAALQLDGTTLWLDGGAALELRRLDPDLALTVEVGSVRIDTGADEPPAELEVAGVLITLAPRGRYRVTLPEGGRGTVLVEEGSAVSGDETVFAGHALILAPAGELLVGDSPGADALDAWADGERIAQHAQQTGASESYLPPAIVGGSELDRAGTWAPASAWGPIWYPTVAVGWAPYTFGHWVWVFGCGYVWVDDASWGYAPFHYGRWVLVGGRWGWLPGHRRHRARFAPALVRFVPSREGRMGWVPLGPREAYVPPHRVSAGYVARVNAPHAGVTTIQRAQAVVRDQPPLSTPGRYFDGAGRHALPEGSRPERTGRESTPERAWRPSQDTRPTRAPGGFEPRIPSAAPDADRGRSTGERAGDRTGPRSGERAWRPSPQATPERSPSTMVPSMPRGFTPRAQPTPRAPTGFVPRAEPQPIPRAPTGFVPRTQGGFVPRPPAAAPRTTPPPSVPRPPPAFSGPRPTARPGGPVQR